MSTPFQPNLVDREIELRTLSTGSSYPHGAHWSAALSELLIGLRADKRTHAEEPDPVWYDRLTAVRPSLQGLSPDELSLFVYIAAETAGGKEADAGFEAVEVLYPTVAFCEEFDRYVSGDGAGYSLTEDGLDLLDWLANLTMPDGTVVALHALDHAYNLIANEMLNQFVGLHRFLRTVRRPLRAVPQG